MAETGAQESSGEIVVRAYKPGDEGTILELFQEVFRVNRGLDHWYWKYRDNPWGREYISTCWIGRELAGHYAGYPVPFFHDGRIHIVYQVGDTMTNPKFRDVGRRRTSVLVRTADHFYTHFCQGKVPFFYGFNTGKIHKFGKLFLRYEPVVPMTVWRMEATASKGPSWFQQLLKGYSLARVDRFPEEMDVFFKNVACRYGNMVARTAEYLNWRYCTCPDGAYDCWLVRARGRCVGFWITKLQGEELLIGDALFGTTGAARWSLGKMLEFHLKEGKVVRSVRGWFGSRPQWWVDFLKDFGFTAGPEENRLKMVLIRFSESIDPATFGEKLYYTWGDRDLF